MKHIYIHVPFCDHICSYCDFFRVKSSDDLIDKWLVALSKEVHTKTYEGIETIYIGGGTPSCLNAKQLSTLLGILKKYQGNEIEYTFEANPESLSGDKIDILKEFNVNRISLGVQTLDSKLLKILNRKHTVIDVKSRIELLIKCGITNISIDLMYGLPFQSTSELIANINEVCTWPIKHISIYSLTIEEHSAFGRENIEAIDNDIEGEMYEEAVKTLERNGFKQYEVANFCRDNFYSRHNIGYWECDDYANLSCGSVGTINKQRIENTKNINAYLNGNIIDNIEELSDKELMFEMIMLGLRLIKGVDLLAFRERFKLDPLLIFEKAIIKHLNENNLIVENNFLKTTSKGMEILHSVLSDFME